MPATRSASVRPVPSFRAAERVAAAAAQLVESGVERRLVHGQRLAERDEREEVALTRLPVEPGKGAVERGGEVVERNRGGE
jgi:hypothetical protein